LGLSLLSLSINATVQAENWPQWRGPRANGVSEEKGLPTEWSDTRNVKWKVPLFGAGVSAPVVWGDAVLLTASDGREQDRLHVLCYHRQDGRLLWHTRLFGSVSDTQSMFAPGGMAVPTVATNGKEILALFGTGDLACLDFGGKPLWIRSLAQEYGPFMNRWGMSSSPILHEDLAIVQVDHWSQSYLLAVEVRSGKNRWKTDRDAAVNWTTPVIARVKDRMQIICLGSYKAKGYDAATGTELWSVHGLQMQCIPSPVVVDDLLLAVSGRKGNSLAIRLDDKGRGDLTGSHVLWKNHRGAPNIPSPICVGNLYFLVDDNGIATCLEVTSGDVLWQERLKGKGQYRASLVTADGKIYCTSLDGDVTVLKVSEKFEILSTNRMGESIIASPAISNGEIFLRGDKHLFCIGKAKN
jgi:outer membrane protein assembly factor BamB